MASCRVKECGREVAFSSDLCRSHYNRLHNYGTAEPYDPIPHYAAPGVSDERVAELKAMSWRELVAYCDWLRS